MSNNWDDEINVSTLTPDERVRFDADAYARQRQENAARRGVIETPALTPEMVREHFASLREAAIDEWRHMIAPWSANRVMWICHDCGLFGFKQTLNELSKCYGYHCRSRNITVCRSGEISLLIRGLLSGPPGLRMTEVFERRQERLRETRAARRAQL